MTRAERKRRAVIGAIALLEWRDRMARENADRENAEREMMARYELTLEEMRRAVSEPHPLASPTPCKLIMAMVHSNGAAGALS
ncbi:MAG: hypothetical protein WBF73_22215 [Bradyrhizobium sp.]|jgi:hypothetical protein